VRERGISEGSRFGASRSQNRALTYHRLKLMVKDTTVQLVRDYYDWLVGIKEEERLRKGGDAD
jgi:hypothetical protein